MKERETLPPAARARASLNLAVVGAGPAGLALALLAARRLPQARISVFDARPADKDIIGDARTLALALGSVQLLKRLNAWQPAAAQPILEVHVSQAPPTLEIGLLQPEVRIRAVEQGAPMLGAVIGYGALVAPMQKAWEAACAAEPQRLRMRFGTPVAGIKSVASGVEIDAGIAETYDLAVVAEGGVFAEQAPKGLTHDYRQNAWVGTVVLRGASPGLAVERFTRSGPVALLPLPAQPALPEGCARAALVWCVDAGDDPVRELDATQRMRVLQTLLPPAAGQVVEVSPFKCFPLGLNAQRTLVEGRSVRIGNAAQTLHPVAGQGLNLGLRDAYALVDALRDADERGRSVDQALARIEWARAPDRWAMIAATDFLARSFTWRWPGLPAVRGLGLAALQSLPPLKSALARRMMFGSR